MSERISKYSSCLVFNGNNFKIQFFWIIRRSDQEFAISSLRVKEEEEETSSTVIGIEIKFK